MALAVLVFTQGWVDGRLTLDGPGVALHARLALDQWLSGGRIPYWLADIWAGTPMWGLAPSLPTLDLLPLAAIVGAEPAVRFATVAGQIVAGWGAFVLATSLWGRRTPAPWIAAFVYALHPLVITHAGLFGHQPSIWVMAATPWLAWSFRRVLRAPGRRMVAVAGLLSAFAVLHQAEHAYILVVMCACMLAVELAAVRRAAPRASGAGAGASAWKPVVTRSAGVAGIALGGVAFWLFPFLSLSGSFLLTPTSTARATLITGIGGVLGRNPGSWLTRSDGVSGVASFEEILVQFDGVTGLSRGSFYLGWVCVVLTAVTIFLLPRRDRDGHFTAILFAGGFGLWLSTAGVSLAASQLVAGRKLVALAVVGAVAGLLVWSFVLRLAPSRRVWAGVGTFAFLVAMPYLTPFLTLQRVVPFLANLRFPRFYPLAALGLALGTAFPILVFQQWLAHRQPRPAYAHRLLVAATAVVAVAFLVDIAPYRSYYHLRAPDGRAAYDRAAETLAATGLDFRVANTSFGDPRPAGELLERGSRLSVGWPHPMASRHIWRLTGETFFAPPAYREPALGLSGTAYTTSEQLSADRRTVEGVNVVRNPLALPLVRTYESTVVVADEAIAPELAVVLARRNIGVVAAGPGAGQPAVGPDACRNRSASTPDLAREVAMACGLHQWVGVYTDLRSVGVGGSGGVFTAPLDGLAGVSVWLDRAPGPTELLLREIGPEGSLGDEVARTTGTSAGGPDFTTFPFAPIEGSAGKRYLFTVSCTRCLPGEEPRMVVAAAERGPGTLIVDGHLDSSSVAAFTLVYEGMPPAPPSTTRVQARSDHRGSWQVQTSGQAESLVVVAEAWFPGWEARVDGQRAPVLLADGAFLGVRVPPGDHGVALTFSRPPEATAGLLVTLATLVVSTGMLLPRRRRRPDGVAGGGAQPAGEPVVEA